MRSISINKYNLHVNISFIYCDIIAEKKTRFILRQTFNKNVFYVEKVCQLF